MSRRSMPRRGRVPKQDAWLFPILGGTAITLFILLIGAFAGWGFMIMGWTFFGGMFLIAMGTGWGLARVGSLCPRCWYDLSAHTGGAWPITCSECGTSYAKQGMLGKNRPNRKTQVLGLLVIVLGMVVGGFAIVKVQPIRWQPMWWLAFRAGASTAAYDEIVRRSAAPGFSLGSLQQSQIGAVVLARLRPAPYKDSREFIAYQSELFHQLAIADRLRIMGLGVKKDSIGSEEFGVLYFGRVIGSDQSAMRELLESWVNSTDVAEADAAAMWQLLSRDRE